MNLSQITYYLEVCNTLNFTHAAQNLYVSQPSLSRQIQLLVRSNRSVRLTVAGEVFRDEFQKIMTDIKRALNRVKASVR